VTPTSPPLVAEFTITVPADTTAEVEFGPDTNSGYRTKVCQI